MGEVLAIIPARYASTRLPGKPLVDIAGTPMIVRVCQQAAKAQTIDRVLVATDDQRIVSAVEAGGFSAVMTSESCTSGSDRAAEAVAGLSEAPSLVVNVQGDEPLIDPRDIDALVADRAAYAEGIGTLARPFQSLADFENPHLVKAVRTPSGRALYFSRAPIPHGKLEWSGSAVSGHHRPFPALHHVGIYAYPPEVLTRFSKLPPSPLECLEKLEQLRALENGIPIQVTLCVSEHPSIGVDVPDDVLAVTQMLAQEGAKTGAE